MSEQDTGGLLDLEKLIKDVERADLDPAIFDVDIDLPKASNVIDFAISANFLNVPTLFAKQAEQAVRLFADWCPTCTDTEWFKTMPVDAPIGEFQDRVRLLEYGRCTKCSQNRIELFEKYPPFELVSCLGQRSGKSILAGTVISTYQLHRYLKMPNPHRQYSITASTYLQMTFVAVTSGQAYETLWTYFIGGLNNSPWFKNYHKAMRDLEKKSGATEGALIKVMDTYAWYGQKQIGASYQAADMKTLRGRNRILGAIDELGWFNNSAGYVRANAEETYAALSNSLRTIRSAADKLWDNGDYDIPTGLMLNLSSPSSQYDKIMSLLREGERDVRKVCMHLASWEANPNISRKSLESEEITNPVKFWRDFGAVPPLANDPFIGSEKATQQTGSKDEPIFKTRMKYIKDGASDAGRFIAAELVDCAKDKTTARIVTCDAGETGNSFAISIHHLEVVKDENGKPTSEVLVRCGGAVEVQPEKIIEKNEIIPIHFPTMFAIVLELCKNFNVLIVAYDRWQSTGEVQRLRDLKVKAEKYSPREADFKEFRSLVLGGNYKLPRLEHRKLEDLDLTDISAVRKATYTHFAVQIATVREVGRKVIKPEFGEDDLFRTAVLATSYLNSAEYREQFLKAGLGVVKRAAGTLGVVRGKTSSFGGGSSAVGQNKLGSVKPKSSNRR